MIHLTVPVVSGRPRPATGGHPAAARALSWLFLALSAALLSCADSPSGPRLPPEVTDAAASITPQSIGAVINALAHDSTKGRGTPSPELDRTAAWLARELDLAGLSGGADGFLQPFDYTYRTVDGDAAALSVAGEPLDLVFGQDYLLFAATRQDTTGPLIWAGHVDSQTPAPDLDLNGALVLFDHPGTRIDADWFERIVFADSRVYERGTAGVGVVVPATINADSLAARMALISARRWWEPIFVLTEGAAEDLAAGAGTTLAELRQGDGAVLADRFRVYGPLKEHVARPANVVGVLTGSDPALRDTYVVLSAHYDHLGVGFADATGDSIYNGADDNASGTAAILEVVRALASMEVRPRRSILFLATAAEEKGLLGAVHFVTSPTVPASSLVADINLDMIARNGTGQVAGIGMLYTTLGDMALEVLADEPDLGLVMTHVGGTLYRGASDHAAFVEIGVPSLFLHSGLHDQYHEASDEPTTVNDDKAARVARLAFYLAYMAADSEDPVAWTDRGRAEVETAN